MVAVRHGSKKFVSRRLWRLATVVSSSQRQQRHSHIAVYWHKGSVNSDDAQVELSQSTENFHRLAAAVRRGKACDCYAASKTTEGGPRPASHHGQRRAT